MFALRLQRPAIALACVSFVASLSLPALAQSQDAAIEGNALPTVVVKGKADKDLLPAAAPGGKVATGARLGVLGNTGVMDAAFNITGFTAEQVKDQNARTVADVLLNDPSVQYTSNGGHMVENFTIRGFDVASNDLALNGLYGLLPAQHVPVEFLERVELLKGPNALLGGMSPNGNVGGMINLVPKRAGSVPLTELTTSYSSGSYGQVQLDVGRRFGEDQRLGVRVNGVYGQGDTGVDDQEKGRRLAALGLDYQGSGWKLALDAYANTETIDNGSPGMYQMTTLGHLVTPPDSSTNMFLGTHGESESNGVALRADVELTDNISAYATFGAAESSSHGLLFGTRVILTSDNGNANGYVYNLANISHTRTAEAGLKADVSTWGIKHSLTASVSTMQYEYWNANAARTGWTQNIYNPVAPQFPAAPSTVPQTRDDEYNGLALADTLHLFDDKVLLTLGARLQQVNQSNPSSTLTSSKYDESTVTPALAVVYKPWGDKVSFYGNHIEGLSPGTTIATGYTNSGTSLSPYKTKQSEVGVKLRQGDLTHTFSLFRISKPSAIAVTYADNTLPTMTSDGEQRHEGAEWNFSGRVLRDLSLLGGYTYTRAVYERTASATTTGKGVIGVPTQALVLGADWQTPLRGLSLNGRVNRVGEQWLDSANKLRLPSWTRLDLGGKYDTKIAAQPVVFRATVENVENKNYWANVFSDGFATLSSPRTVRVSATVSF